MHIISSIEILEDFKQQINEQLPCEKHFLKCLTKLVELMKFEKPKQISVEKLDKKLVLLQDKKKYLQEELNDLEKRIKEEIRLKDEIILQNNKLIKQEEKQHTEKLNQERNTSKLEINLRKELFESKKRYEYQPEIDKLLHELESVRFKNVSEERILRKKWITMKEELRKINHDYETQMSTLQEQLKNIQQTHETEIKELQHFKNLFDMEDGEYHDLMKEKEEYEEGVRQQKLYDLRVKMAKRTIVKFIEQNYPTWKKKKMKAMKKKSKYRYYR